MAFPRLLHFKGAPALGPIRDTAQRWRSWMKPAGLWVSVEDGRAGWCDYLRSDCADTVAERTAHVWEIVLAEGANVLHLKTAEELLALTARFADNDADGIGNLNVKWSEIAERYDGIVIAPYQRECRLNNETLWYYGWDCAGGCIWRARAIAELKKIDAAQFVRAAA